MSLLTFIPMDEVKRLGALEGSEINHAKEVLATEITRMVHGEEEAQKALAASKALFGQGQDMSDVPMVKIDRSSIEGTISINDLLFETKIVATKSEGRRLVQQGGVYLNEETVTSHDQMIGMDDFNEGTAMIRKGKKKHYKVVMI